jgi:hypothetical protein
MGGTTVLPPSQPPRRTAAVADLYARTRRITINPSCMANPAETKNPKRPAAGSMRGGEPPAKRVRGVDEPRLSAAVSIGSKKSLCPSSGKDMTSSKRLESTVIRKKPVQPPIHPSDSESTAQAKTSSTSMRELIERARQAKERPAAEAAIEINRRRMEARRILEQMVATVEFNDPFIDFTDVSLSREQLIDARQAAADAQDRIVAMARGREIEALK